MSANSPLGVSKAAQPLQRELATVCSSSRDFHTQPIFVLQPCPVLPMSLVLVLHGEMIAAAHHPAMPMSHG